MTITRYGKGGTTSSGNWHVEYTEEKTSYNGYKYTATFTKSFFRKADMLAFVNQNTKELAK